MATDSIETHSDYRFKPEPSAFASVLTALASLKLTVVLFALSIFLVFVGTLAQVDHDIWRVVNHTYFRVWFAQVEFQAFFRLFDTLFQAKTPDSDLFFYFPGGKTIGLLLALNLLSAHAIRFKINAKGARLARGLVVLALGMVVTALVIASGMDNTVESQLSTTFTTRLWHALRIGVAGTALYGGYWLITNYRLARRAEWSVALAIVAAIAGCAIYLFANPEFQLNPASLRILWQLIKGGAAALVLLSGCVLLFKKRAGVVLLHGGIGLLMLGELITDPVSNETNMVIQEGQTASYTYNTHKPELAIVDQSDPKEDAVTVIPFGMLEGSVKAGETIAYDSLPFDVRVLEYYQNSALRPLQPNEKTLATEGLGRNALAEEQKRNAGTGDRQGTDLQAAYVELVDRESGEPIGVWMTSVVGDTWFTTQPLFHQADRAGTPNIFRRWHDELGRQTVSYKGKPYHIALRYKREYRDWIVRLNKFTHDKYVGTSTPKNYASDVTLIDPARGIDRSFEIKMNNPLRYDGHTFYQSAFDGVTNKATVLQVVKSRSWMVPYVACMIVGFGMVAHFGVTLNRFMQRRVKEAVAPESIQWTSPGVLVPITIALLCGGYTLSKAKPLKDDPKGLPVHRLGAIALADGGRIKPMDTYARTVLQRLSERREVNFKKLPEKDIPKCAKGLKKAPAIKWLLDTVTGAKGATDYRVFSVRNLDILQAIKLKPRPGSYRYSYNELTKLEGELQKQFDKARKVEKEQRTPFQAGVIDLSTKLLEFRAMRTAFGSPALGGKTDQAIEQSFRQAIGTAMSLRDFEAPRPVPPTEVDAEWKTLFEARLEASFNSAGGHGVNPATLALSDALLSYGKNDRAAMADALDELELQLAKHQKKLRSPVNAEKVAGLANAEKLNLAKVRFEKFFSSFSPFYNSSVLYLIAFVFLCLSWLTSPRILARTATAIVVVALLVHTYAIVGRISISGRPPVTNLYSSAVFIGWAAVVLGLILEAIFRMGIGTLVSTVVGFLSLVVAYYLSLDNDTFTVMRAVLDTQFWLATHVVCITFGYATTFLTGFLGVAYLVGYRFVGRLSDQDAKRTLQMLYGTLCFSIIFSFIGTVLGGLWGDDSWGRFWGWDPKENGALIIVLWNALVLHARWGNMVSGRGLATLAVAGNIVTCWSWFGVNALGVGLHAYGGMSGRMSYEMFALHIVLWSHLLIVFMALLPKETWGRKSSSLAL